MFVDRLIIKTDGTTSATIANEETNSRDTGSELVTEGGTTDIATDDIATDIIATVDIATTDIATADIATADIATADIATSDCATVDVTIAVSTAMSTGGSTANVDKTTIAAGNMDSVGADIADIVKKMANGTLEMSNDTSEISVDGALANDGTSLGVYMYNRNVVV